MDGVRCHQDPKTQRVGKKRKSRKEVEERRQERVNRRKFLRRGDKEVKYTTC
jgi:hypothetical protein